MSALSPASAAEAGRRKQAKTRRKQAKSYSNFMLVQRHFAGSANRAVFPAIIDGMIVVIDGERFQVGRRYFAGGHDRSADVVLLRSSEEPRGSRSPYIRAMQVRDLECRISVIREPHRRGLEDATRTPQDFRGRHV